MIHGCHFERAEKSHGIDFNLKFILSVGSHVKHKGLSYKDVRRPFIVFKGGGDNHIWQDDRFVASMKKCAKNLRV